MKPGTVSRRRRTDGTGSMMRFAIDRVRRMAAVRRLAGEHLVQHAAEAVEIADRPSSAGRRWPAQDSCTPACPRMPVWVSCRRPRPERAGDPEVGHQRVPAGEQDVLRLDVAMHNTLAVGIAEGVGHLPCNLQGVLDGELALPRQPTRRLSPSTNGIVYQSWPELSPESWTGRMFGCCRRAVVRISRWKRSGPRVAASSGCNTFIATFRSCLMSCTKYTVAIAPRPSSRCRT